MWATHKEEEQALSLFTVELMFPIPCNPLVFHLLFEIVFNIQNYVCLFHVSCFPFYSQSVILTPYLWKALNPTD